MSRFIGILSLDTAFPRIAGDAGNPESYHLPARVSVVAGAGSTEIVRDGRPDPELVSAFRAAAETFVAEGACLVTSTCGFLVTVQADVARDLGVPVLLSSLSLVPLARAATGRAPVGVLTASAAALGPGAIRAAGAEPEDVRIAGLDGDALFASVFLAARAAQRDSFDRSEVEGRVAAAAEALVTRAPEIGSIVLECGNLPPYAEAVRRVTGRPVLSILDGARLLAPA